MYIYAYTNIYIHICLYLVSIYLVSIYLVSIYTHICWVYIVVYICIYDDIHPVLSEHWEIYKHQQPLSARDKLIPLAVISTR